MEDEDQENEESEQEDNLTQKRNILGFFRRMEKSSKYPIATTATIKFSNRAKFQHQMTVKENYNAAKYKLTLEPWNGWRLVSRLSESKNLSQSLSVKHNYLDWNWKLWAQFTNQDRHQMEATCKKSFLDGKLKLSVSNYLKLANDGGDCTQQANLTYSFMTEDIKHFLKLRIKQSVVPDISLSSSIPLEQNTSLFTDFHMNRKDRHWNHRLNLQLQSHQYTAFAGFDGQKQTYCLSREYKPFLLGLKLEQIGNNIVWQWLFRRKLNSKNQLNLALNEKRLHLTYKFQPYRNTSIKIGYMHVNWQSNSE